MWRRRQEGCSTPLTSSLLAALSHPLPAHVQTLVPPTVALDRLAAAYLAPFANITLSQLDDAHLRWADYRDAEWGAYVPPGEYHNRLLRINILGGRLHYVNCAGSRSVRRLTRQATALRLIAHTLAAHDVPDVDLVVSLSDRPTVPRRAVPTGLPPPPVFGYARTPAHHAIPFPPVSFDPLRWPALHGGLTARPPLASRAPVAIWRGACNSLCDGMRDRRCAPPRDLPLLHRYALLRAAARCPRLADVGVTSAHRHCPGARPKPALPMGEHARFAFLLHVDGNGFSGRLDELLTLGGVVLKQARGPITPVDPSSSWTHHPCGFMIPVNPSSLWTHDPREPIIFVDS